MQTFKKKNAVRCVEVTVLAVNGRRLLFVYFGAAPILLLFSLVYSVLQLFRIGSRIIYNSDVA